MKDFSALPIKKLRITNLLEMRLVSSLLWLQLLIWAHCRFPLFRINYALSSEPTSNC
jgi:hypothetical protein